MPVHTYTNWNIRPYDDQEQLEPFRKYFFICEGANTETFYFRKLIDLRKQLNIHQMIDVIQIAIEQEKLINQNIHNVKGKVTSNIASIIGMIISDKPDTI